MLARSTAGDDVVVNVILEDVDSSTVRMVMDAAEALRNEYGVAVRLEVKSFLWLDPVAGFVHDLGNSVPERGTDNIVISGNDGAVRVFVREPYDRDKLEEALVMAALKALGGGESYDAEQPLHLERRSDPGVFASGEYVFEDVVLASS